jgi:hypothetical protein
MENQGSRPLRGRPPKSGERKRGSFNTRLRDSLKVQLEAAAALAGRSLSEEIEFRLERSLDGQQFFFIALEAAFGREITGLALLLGLAMSEALRYAEPLVGRENERGWPFRRRGNNSKMTADEVEEFFSYLWRTFPVAKRRGIEDPFIFDRVVKAAERVLQDFRPNGDPALPRLKGKNPEMLQLFGLEMGSIAVDDACKSVVDGGQQNTIINLIGDFLSEAAKKRIGDRLAERNPEGWGAT